MTACLGTNLCEIATGMVTLQDGSSVCNACPAYALQREAERLLTYPLPERREGLKVRTQLRGPEAVARLKDMMARLHAGRAR